MFILLNYIRKISSKTSHKDKYLIISSAAVRRAYFDGFQIVAVSFSAEFSFSFCCFVFDVEQRQRKLYTMEAFTEALKGHL